MLEIFDRIFDVLKPSEDADTAADNVDERLSDAKIEELIEQRSQAKRSRDFARADEIRAMLHDSGIVLEDTKDGVRWKRK